MDQCEICSARVLELRRGRCWGCYSRWVDTRPVGVGASCRLCGERRRGFLRSLEFRGSWVSTCFNCAGRIGALSPPPASLADAHERLDRERRNDRRRWGKPEGRVFPYERRDVERRTPRLARGTSPAPEEPVDVDEAMVLEIAELASELEALAAELPGDSAPGELTTIRMMPSR